jgi:hypothetical protein
VLSLSTRITIEQAETLKKHLKMAFVTDNKIVVLEDGMKLEVVTPEGSK